MPMEIKIIGCGATQKRHIKNFVNFCHKMLMPRMNNLQITIHRKHQDAYGYCTSFADDRTDRPRRFTIEVGRHLRLHSLLLTIGHEMVHVRQFARGELLEGTRTPLMRWQGEWMDHNKVDYWDRPWEIEAHGREEGLFVRWAETNKLLDKKWIQKD